MSHSIRSLKLFDVFCLASGAMISSGIFVLPAYVYNLVGPSMILAYLLAGMLVLPASLSQAELASAMPKSGGTYFFTVRSLGSLWGTFAGFSNWFSIALKGAFALVGMGTFLQLFYADIQSWQIKSMAIFAVILFTLINLKGTKSSAHSGNFMVIILLATMIFFIIGTSFHLEISHFTPFFTAKKSAFFSVTAMVFISYGGLTKIASIGDEIQNPHKNIPRGMLLGYVIVNILYVAILFSLIGVLYPADLQNSYTPLSAAANVFWNPWGGIIMTLSAIFAFATTANASIMAASRAPIAMAEDKLLPRFFMKKTNKNGIPYVSILVTSGFMITVILALNLNNLVKAASAMMLILFIFTCLSVLLNRYSQLTSYRPTFLCKGFPYIPILGIIAYTTFLFSLGSTPLLITLLFFLISASFYWFYARKKNIPRPTALIRLVELITNKKLQNDTLDDELTTIILERDNIILDRFDKLVQTAIVLYYDQSKHKNELFEEMCQELSPRLGMPQDELIDLFHERESLSSTVINSKVAIPHIVIQQDVPFEILIAYNPQGFYFDEKNTKIELVFCLIGDISERNFHLQILVAIAQIIQNKHFASQYNKSQNANELRNLILSTQRDRQDK